VYIQHGEAKLGFGFN